MAAIIAFAVVFAFVGSAPWLDDTATAKGPDAWVPGRPNKKGVGTWWTDPANQGNGIWIDQSNPLNTQVSQWVDQVMVRSGSPHPVRRHRSPPGPRHAFDALDVALTSVIPRLGIESTGEYLESEEWPEVLHAAGVVLATMVRHGNFG